jgi:hypothetical protein
VRFARFGPRAWRPAVAASGLLRQYSESASLAGYTEGEFDAVACELNDRHRRDRLNPPILERASLRAISGQASAAAIASIGYLSASESDL